MFLLHFHSAKVVSLLKLGQAPWCAEECSASLAVNALYEASGLALWLQTEAFAADGAKPKGVDPLHVDVPDIAWKQLVMLEDSFFSQAALQKSFVQRGSKKMARERLLWPLPMICGVHQAKAAADASFDSSLKLANGHYILWAWYLAMFRALQQKAPLAESK